MVRPPVEHRVDGPRPSVEVEAGQAVHQVDAQIGAPRLPRRLERGAGAARVVEAAEPREDRVVERLDTEAQPIHACRAIALELLARHALGVALDGDLGIRADVEASADSVERRRQVLGGQERGRAPTHEDGREAHPRCPRERAEEVDLAMERLEVAGHGPLLEGRGVEAAVAAPLRAERDMDVQPERVRLRRVIRQHRRERNLCWCRAERVVRRSGAGSRLSQATLGPSRAHGPRYNRPGSRLSQATLGPSRAHAPRYNTPGARLSQATPPRAVPESTYLVYGS